MSALVVAHRWLGVAFCLLFAMWFATGMVMHFVPFPALSEAERVAGLRQIDPAEVRYPASSALTAAGMRSAARVRLIARADGPVYVFEGTSGIVAIRAADLSLGIVETPALALKIAHEHARNRGLAAGEVRVHELASHDQWTVPNALDVHRPLYRMALEDDAGTELYVSSRTGEVVADSTRRERAWNYIGSVTHWIYPTVLRRNWKAWDTAVWTLSLIAFVAALSGAFLGALRLRVRFGRLATPFTGWHAWHHWLGIGCMVFVLTWIASGWLSMDHGRLFSTGKASSAEVRALQGNAITALTLREIDGVPRGAREVTWFPFDGRLHRRERFDLVSQRLVESGAPYPAQGGFLRRDLVTHAAERLWKDCGPAAEVDAVDAYRVRGPMPGAPVYRTTCGDVWFHVDGADGSVLEKLDTSRRSYRWLYSALHTLDLPPLVARPLLRSALIVLLCTLGLGFSVTAVVIAWRRVSRSAANAKVNP